MTGRRVEEQICGVHSAAYLYVLSLLVGCDNLDRFDTSGGAAYCGELVAPTFAQDGLLPDDSDEKAEARLELDLDNAAKRPGTLWTSDAKWGLCTPESLFDAAPLRTIEQVENDPIASLDFGEGREHSFFAWADSTCQGTMLSVVSLMRNGGVELRLFKPAPERVGRVPAAERAGFGVFLLKRHPNGCGF
jgi:hypothetical protein